MRIKNGSRMELNVTIKVYPTEYYTFCAGTKVDVRHYRFELDNENFVVDSAKLIRIETVPDKRVVHVHRWELKEVVRSTPIKKKRLGRVKEKVRA